jgi:hypothetical protein
MRENNDDERNIFALLERLHAVEKHRLPRHPPELLELLSASAGSFSAGDDYHADVRIH